MPAINEQVIQLLSTLRESNLSWIAEEINEAIDQGKSILKEKREIQDRQGVYLRKNDLETISLSPEEEMSLMLRSLNNYLIELPNIQLDSLNMLKKDLESDNLSISIADSGGEIILNLTDKLIQDGNQKLENFLKEALSDYPHENNS